MSGSDRQRRAGDLEAEVARWVRPEVRALTAYHVPEAQGLIKLDAMENPYGWPPALVEEWLAALRAVRLNRYPDPAARRLKQRLRETFGVPDGVELLLGNGSDELIQMVAMALAGPGRAALAPEPAFSMYRVIAGCAGLRFVGVPLAADFALDVDAMRAAIARHAPAVVFIDYPNNPSGRLFDEDAVRAVIAAAPGLVVLDEAYAAFSGVSFLPRVAEFGNLLILRTLSKMGLAGLRLGLLAGDRRWLAELDKIRLPYNINVLTQVSAEFALGHREVLERQARDICRDREALAGELRRLPGVEIFPSRANFILFRAPAGRGAAVCAALRARGVLIKDLTGAGGALRDCLRVTVGTPDENRAFLAALAAAW